jgi:hypothetical protein
MLTRHNGVFRIGLDTAKMVAECANLRLITSPSRSAKEGARWHVGGGDGPYWSWEDDQTGGGGCRITWVDGIAWVSRHSGYAWADITDEVCDLIIELGGKPLDLDASYRIRNPRIYGWRDYVASSGSQTPVWMQTD